MEYRVNEIFESIEGEGVRAGLPCLFIRLVGCNLRCPYCDTAYAFEPSETDEVLTELELAECAQASGLRAVTLTGGEPLAHAVEPLLDALVAVGCTVNVETNGSLPLPPARAGVFYTMDWKAPSSGCADAMLAANLDRLTCDDVLKFVVANKEDLDAARALLSDYDIKAQVFFSPVFDAINPRKIAEYLVKHRLEARLQLQLHKIIWDSDARGV